MTHCTSTIVAFMSVCSAANATFTTVPSMKAMLDARIVTTSIQRLEDFGQGAVAGCDRIMLSSQGSRMNADMISAIITELSSHLHGFDLIFRKGVVGITIEPALARLRRRDHGMPALVCVFAGMLIWRAVAAERDATCLAGSEMNPVVADLHACFAFAALRPFDRCDRGDVNTGSHTCYSRST
jgi:hypothetical protein